MSRPLAAGHVSLSCRSAGAARRIAPRKLALSKPLLLLPGSAASRRMRAERGDATIAALPDPVMRAVVAASGSWLCARLVAARWRDAVNEFACSATLRPWWRQVERLPLGLLLHDAAAEARCIRLDVRRGAVQPIVAAPSVAMELDASMVRDRKRAGQPPPRKRKRCAAARNDHTPAMFVAIFGV